MEGEVQSVKEQYQGTTEVTAIIAKAARAKERGDLSYTNCTEYIGKPLTVSFEQSSIFKAPVVGDNILFSRSAVDGFGKNGAYLGTTVKARLLQVRPASPAGSGR